MCINTRTTTFLRLIFIFIFGNLFLLLERLLLSKQIFIFFILVIWVWHFLRINNFTVLFEFWSTINVSVCVCCYFMFWFNRLFFIMLWINNFTFLKWFFKLFGVLFHFLIIFYTLSCFFFKLFIFNFWLLSFFFNFLFVFLRFVMFFGLLYFSLVAKCIV